MADKLSPERRSENMRRITSKHSRPEMIVRRLAHRLGFRFRLHRHDLPGKPDLTFPGRKVAIFVHGCFWHQHPGCREGRVPSSRNDYWGPKLARNVLRDKLNQEKLQKLGWHVVTIWECETDDESALTKVLKATLGRRST